MSETYPPTTYATMHVDRAAALLRDREMPASVGPYRMIELIAEGGMGEVYKAQQEHPIQRTVALKLIKLGMDSRQVIARFESERQTLALMRHPNVAAVYDAGLSEAGRPYFVMEYVPGESITTFCDRHALTIERRLELFIQVCDAVQHAHQKTIIHRDLKPGNMLVSIDESGKASVKVIDFGIAKATAARRLSNDLTLTQLGQLLGTPEYMSPEQADLNATDVDTRADIYSLGVVLYELLIGAKPFDAETWRNSSYDEIRHLIREVDPPRPSTRLQALGDTAIEIAKHRQTQLGALQRELRHELEWIPLKALRKDRTERYRTAAELADDIRNYLADRPLVAGPESRGYRLKKFLRRNRRGVAASAAMFALVAAGASATAWQAIRANRQATVARQEADRQAAVNRFLHEMLSAVNPSQATLANPIKGRDVTLLQVVNAAATELDAGALRDRPELEAAVRTTLGQTYHNLGEYDRADSNLRTALALNERVFGPDHRAVAVNLEWIGNVLTAQGKHVEGERFLARAHEQLLRIQGERSVDVADCLMDQARNLAAQDRLTDAESTFRRALSIYRDTTGSKSESVADLLNHLGALLARQSNYAAAEAVLGEALMIQREIRGAEHPAVASALETLGGVHEMRGDLAGAEPLLRESLRIKQKLVGDDHPTVGHATYSLGTLRVRQGDLDEAETLLRRALDIQIKAHGVEHPRVAATMTDVAVVLNRRRKHAEAETMLREAIAMDRKLLGSNHAETARAVNNLGVVLRMLRKREEAEQAFRESLAIHRQVLGNDHPHVATLLNSVADVLFENGKPAEAEPLVREAMRIQDAKLKPGHWERAGSDLVLGEVLGAMKRFDEAEPLVLGAYERLSNDPRCPRVVRIRSGEAVLRLYTNWGKTDKVDEWQARLRPATTQSSS